MPLKTFITLYMSKKTHNNGIMSIEKKRDSNFELLRIIAMFAIVMAHQKQHGLWFEPNCEVTFNFLLSRFRLGWLGNILFMMISGYFMANVTFSWKKVFKLWLEIFTISAGIGLFTYFSKIPVVSTWYDSENYLQFGFFATAHQATIKELIRSFLPTFFANNWFAAAYIVFYFFAPFCAILFNTLTEKQHRNLLFCMLFFGTIVPFFPKEALFVGDNLFLFMLCFCTADYIRRYDPKILQNTKMNIILSLALLIFFFCWIAFSYLVLFEKFPVLKNHIDGIENRFTRMNTPTAFLCGTLIFCVFRQMKIPYNRFINTVASATFGVYLLHENWLIKRAVWHGIFKLDDWISSPYLLPYMFFCAIVVFIVCTIIELLRKKLFDRLF